MTINLGFRPQTKWLPGQHVLPLWSDCHWLPQHGCTDVLAHAIAFLTPPLIHPRCSVVEKRDDRIMLSYHDGKATVDLLGGEDSQEKGGWRGS